MATNVIARCDPSLGARVVRRWPLFYTAGADERLDRPAHVRAGSGLTAIGKYLALIQDDANFVAMIEPTARVVESVTLPAVATGQRQFDDLRGNRKQKLDLEACTTIVENDRQILLAMGSGSSPARESILLMTWPAMNDEAPRLYHAPAFYEHLRTCQDFGGSELNVEGAAFDGDDTLTLIQRGNGAARNGLQPINATCEVSWRALRSHLLAGAPLPACPKNVTQYDLGVLDDVRLTFTDGSFRENSFFFTATAEASPDAIEDGPVAGSVLGQAIRGGAARWTILRDEQGNRVAEKVEGLSLDRSAHIRGWVAIDRDNPLAPSELCEIELSGDWSDGH